MFIIAILILLAAPLLLVVFRKQAHTTASYTLNQDGNGLFIAVCSIICGNVGIGTFVAIFLFTQASPVIGLSIVVAYTIGLFACSFIAPLIHKKAREFEAYSLIDFINHAHGNGALFPIWIPISLIFILRSSVQLTALAMIIASAFDIGLIASLSFSAVLVGSYTLVGGYKAATESDVIQAGIIFCLVLVALTGMNEFEMRDAQFFDLGPYKPFLLIGIFLFVPFSAPLAVDNWQRMATTPDASTARLAYAIAAVLCSVVYGTIWLAGMLPSSTGDALQTFRSFMPEQMPWLADVLFITCIISSIDTFVMPLVTPLARRGASLAQLRWAVAALFCVLACVSLILGDLLENVIAAFNSLTVFLPSVVAALCFKKLQKWAAWASLNAGIVATLLLSAIDINMAAIGGFAFSTIVYLAVSYGHSRLTNRGKNRFSGNQIRENA